MIDYCSAQPSDAEGIAALHARSWRRNYRGIFLDEFLDGDLLEDRRRVWRERLDQPAGSQFVFVAVEDSRVLGFICAYGAQDLQWGSFIDNIHVARCCARRGIGSSLMRQAGAWLASAHGEAGIYLWVLEANSAARRFYERLGGRSAGVFVIENPSGGTAPSCRYVWDGPEKLTAGQA